jgi:hypothetical protein
MKRYVIGWAVLGFVIPLFWGIMSFIFFAAKESIWTNVYWGLVYATCPFWLLPTNTMTTVLMPFLNAALYGCLGLIFSPGAPSFRSIIAEGWDTSNSKEHTATTRWGG